MDERVVTEFKESNEDRKSSNLCDDDFTDILRGGGTETGSLSTISVSARSVRELLVLLALFLRNLL